MRFVSIYKFDPATHNGPPAGQSLRVRRTGNNVSVTDGPFTESKEVVGGCCVFDVASRDEAIEWSRRFLELVGDGVTEMHEIGEP
jgi:hypothetical protein